MRENTCINDLVPFRHILNKLSLNDEKENNLERLIFSNNLFKIRINFNKLDLISLAAIIIVLSSNLYLNLLK